MVKVFDEDAEKFLQYKTPPSQSLVPFTKFETQPVVQQQPKHGPVVQQQPKDSLIPAILGTHSLRATTPSRLLSLREYLPQFQSTLGKRAGALRKWLPTVGGEMTRNSQPSSSRGRRLLPIIEPIEISPLQFPARNGRAISDIGIRDKSTLHLCLPLAAAAEVENLSQKKKELLWLEMTTPDERLAD